MGYFIHFSSFLRENPFQIDFKKSGSNYRSGASIAFLKVGGQVVIWQAAAAQRHILFCQNLGGQMPPCPPFIDAPDCYIVKNFIVFLMYKLICRNQTIFYTPKSGLAQMFVLSSFFQVFIVHTWDV